MRKVKSALTRTASGIPTPMPALAEVLRPWDCWLECAAFEVAGAGDDVVELGVDA